MAGIPAMIGTLGLVYGFQKVVGGINEMRTATADFGEVQSKTRAILLDSAPAVEALADAYVEGFGVVRTEVLDAASAFAGLGKGLGHLTGTELSKFTNRLVQLNYDLVSFADVSADAARQALTIGLSGEQSDTLKKLGVVLLEANVNAYAFSHGLARVNAKLTDSQKLAARMGIIEESFKRLNLTGDLERTIGSTKNQMRKAAGDWQNLMIDMGLAVKPLTDNIVTLKNVAIGGLSDAFRENKTAIAEWSSSALTSIGDVWTDTIKPGFDAIRERLAEMPANLAAAFGPSTVDLFSGFASSVKTFVLDVIDGIGFAWRNLPDLVDVAVLMIEQKILDLGAYFEAFLKNVGQFGTYIAGNWKELIVDAFSAIGKVIENLGVNLLNLWQGIQSLFSGEGFTFEFTPLLEGFKATAAELPKVIAPEFVSLQEEIDKKLAGIATKEVERSAKLAGRAAEREAEKLAPKAAEVPKAALPEEEAKKAAAKEKGPMHAAALMRGSVEARSAVLKFQGMGAAEEPIKKLAKAGEEQVGLQKRMVDGIDKLVKKPTGIAGDAFAGLMGAV